jgi:3-hydroxyacyl-[acyl-carrier-protein] dehydratase
VKVRIDTGCIMKMLPHRYPFLLIDRVTELEPGKSAVGIKNVTINEPFFQGHFPGEPIVPGVLLLESLAQLTAVMYGAAALPEGTDFANLNEERFSGIDLAGKVGYLAESRNVKFKSLVRPGDTLELHAVKKIQMGLLSQIQVFARVDGQVVVEGIITVSQKA